MKPKVAACRLVTVSPSLAKHAPASNLSIAMAALSVSASYAGRAVETLLKTAKTGKIRDGKILLFGIEDTIRIRSQARGESGLPN